MIVPVLWISRHPEILDRGYADMGFLEAMLARQSWTPPDALVFEHYAKVGMPGGEHEVFPDVEGALVVLPARHHTSYEDVSWFKTQLDNLTWSLVLLAGDEEWAFPWERIPELERRKVWTMQPIPGHEKLSGMIPGGWYPGTHEMLAEHRDLAMIRELDWFFAGQITHERRVACVDAVEDLPFGHLHKTPGYLQGMPKEHYFRLMAMAKVIPSPSGPCSVDTARTFEALEAGCIPVADLLKPREPQFDYWELLFGPGYPFPVIEDWATFPKVLDATLDGWLPKSNRCFAFWQAWKRRITRQLDSDLRAVADIPASSIAPDDLITVIVTTSPTPNNPGTEIIEETIASVRAQLPTAEIIIAIDGVRPEQSDRGSDYDEYVRRLLWLTNFEWHNVLPIVLDRWLHQAGSTKAAMAEVQTPMVLFVEHDTPIVGEVDWPGLCAMVSSGEANAVRLHHETTVLPDHRDLMLDAEPFQVETSAGLVPAVRTVAWWQRPHLASAAFYRERILSVFADEARTMIEDVIYGIVSSAYVDRGPNAWAEWKLWIYAPDSGPEDALGMKRSTHLDGRGSDPKYPMHFVYAGGESPDGAPWPT